MESPVCLSLSVSKLQLHLQGLSTSWADGLPPALVPPAPLLSVVLDASLSVELDLLQQAPSREDSQDDPELHVQRKFLLKIQRLRQTPLVFLYFLDL